MQTIIISGINLFQGGTLTVYYSFLDSLIHLNVLKTYRVIALVHKTELFDQYSGKIEVLEFPRSRKRYLMRLWYEYIYFYFFSKRIKPAIWISLHDMTPNVKAEKLYTYCHNPSPFYKMSWKEIKYSPITYLFTKFYKYIYGINIKKNTAVIVQQGWIRKNFQDMFSIKDIIVARPYEDKNIVIEKVTEVNEKFTFIFPSLPRVFKNFEIVCKACQELEKRKCEEYEMIITLDGNENKYAKDLKKKYGKVKTIKWIGLQTQDNLFKLYSQVDAMIFPSKLETWGLPISEFKQFNKPIILSDLLYAHETLGEYDKVSFFNPSDGVELADKMDLLMHNKMKFEKHNEIIINKPKAENWDELIQLLID